MLLKVIHYINYLLLKNWLPLRMLFFKYSAMNLVAAFPWKMHWDVSPRHLYTISQNLFKYPLQWRHNKRDGVSYHRLLDCLLNRLFRRSPKKTSKLRVMGLCEGNPPMTAGFPSQRGSKAENVSIWWRHNDKPFHQPMLSFDNIYKATLGQTAIVMTSNCPRSDTICACVTTRWVRDTSDTLTV